MAQPFSETYYYVTNEYLAMLNLDNSLTLIGLQPIM